MCTGMFMAVLDIQIVASSLPDIQAGLGIPLDWLSWIQTAYLIAEIIAIPLTGWLTRLLSLRGLFLMAIAGFTLASAGCAASPSFAPLIVFRIVQGFCGGALIPSVFTAIFALFPERLHVRATAIAGVMAMLAPTLGPTIGGYITETYSWHWLFLINIGPGILSGVVAALMLRSELPDRSAAGRLDVLSLILMSVFLAALEIGLKEAPERAWTDPITMTLLAVCVVAGIAGIRRCLARTRPLVDLKLFHERCFAVGCFYSFVLGAGLYGTTYLLPLFLGYVRQHTALEIGEIMFVTGAAQLVTAPIAAILEKRIDARLLTACGYAMFGAGLIANGFSTYETDAPELFWPQILRGAGLMLCLLPTTAVALEGKTGEALADASGLFNLMRNLGGAISIAIIDTILHWRPPVHVAELVRRLEAGDPETARFVGLPLDRFHNLPMGPVDEATKQFVQPLVERAAAVASFNEAFLALGVFFLLSLLVLPLLRQPRTAEVPHHAVRLRRLPH
ncbi:MAG: DHA2 family efflux MFS transporter permease subunit [Alphaproteobacteria bacterium]|nr:DHA2 family efflux MFS transporter permease subunit [Alphaproteobacteria bacterium]